MTASSLAAARAAILRLAHSAPSSQPMSHSAVAAARAAIRGVADNAAAASSSSRVSAYRVLVRALSHNAAGATSSPPTTPSTVAARAVLPNKAAPATSSLMSSPSALTATKPFTSVTVTPTPPSPPNNAALSPRSVIFLVNLLNGMVLTNEDQLLFRKAFNERFHHFKVADVLTCLEHEEFSVEEYCFLLKTIYSKLGANKGLAGLLLNEDINPSPTDDEMRRNPQLSRLECKLDVLTKKFDQASAEILKCVSVSSKGGEWGMIEVYGKKLDLTKLEYVVKKIISIITGF